jgi:uncharacterized lipoprotein NlpE involved in copper resistance
MNKTILTMMALALAGCATRSDIIKENIRHDYKSSKSPSVLAGCIDRNADDFPLNSLRSKITNMEGQPMEVLIRNGDTIYTVVQLAAVDGGSTAAFYLGGAASITPESSVKILTKGCE